MSIIYRKTPKGVTEIETRVHRLHPRLRGVLILIDGRRADTELVQMLQHAAESIVMLLEGGFIEVLMRTAAPSPPLADESAARRADTARDAPATRPRGWSGSSSFGGSGQAAFHARRREAMKLLTDQLGPAAERLAIRMETAQTVEEFRALLPAAVRLVGELRGRAAAEAFNEQTEDI